MFATVRHGYVAALSVGFVAMVIPLVGCGSGGGGGGQGHSALTFSFGAASSLEVDASTMTFVIEPGDLSSVSLVEPVSVQGIVHDGRFYVWEVPLLPGSNELRFEGRRPDGSRLHQKLLIGNSELPSPAVSLSFDPRQCDLGAGTTVLVSIRSDIDAAEFLLDVDADGAIDVSMAPTDSIALASVPPGHHKPRLTVRTAQGLYYSSDAASTPFLSSLPAPAPATAWNHPSILSSVADAELDSATERVWVLGGQPVSLFGFDVQGSLAMTIPLPEVSQPGGFCIAPNGDMYVVDRSGDRVIRLRASLGLSFDPTFAGDGFLGATGSQAGDLRGPSDVALVEDRPTGSTVLCISDTDNDRLQMFELDGTFLRELRGPVSDPLSAPGRVVTLSGGSVAVACPEQGRIRTFAASGEELRGWGSGASRIGSITPTCLSVEPGTLRIVFHDARAGEVVIAESNSEIIRRVRANGPLASVLTLERNGETLLVLGRDGSSAAALEVLSLVGDPAGGRPHDVVQGFFAAILADALPALEPLAAPEFYEELVILAADIDAWEVLRATAAQLIACTTSYQGRMHAGATCVFEADQDNVSLRMRLVRDPQCGRWRVLGP